MAERISAKEDDAAVQAKATDPKLVEAVLKQNHQDAGVNYKAGDTIKVDEVTADWLRKNRVI